MSDQEKRLKSILLMTDDSEIHSEMWIIMSTSEDISAQDALEIAMISLRRSAELSSKMREIMAKPPLSHTVVFLDLLPPVERKVATMMMLGITKDRILEYNYLSDIRYNQVVAAILASNAWRDFLEEETKLRGKTGIGRD